MPLWVPWLRHFHDADPLPNSLLLPRCELPSEPLVRPGGGGVGLFTPGQDGEEKPPDLRVGASGGGVSEPERRLPRPALGGIELEGDSLPQLRADCPWPRVSGPLVRRVREPLVLLSGVLDERPGSCPV